MRLNRLLIVLVYGFSCVGCASNLEGVGAGATPEHDAASCTTLACGIGANLQAHPMDHFLLLSSNSDNGTAATGQFLEQVHNRFYETFGQAGFSLRPIPDKLICVLLDSYAQLDAYGRAADGAQASWMDGYYSYRTNRVVFVRTGGVARAGDSGPSSYSAARAAAVSDPSRGQASCGQFNPRTASHELAHQLAFNSGLQRRDVTYPFWLTEGLATNFEADNPGSCGVPSQDSRYRSRLASAKAGRNLITLGQFVGMTELSSSSTQSTINSYAQAWGLFHFLLQHHRKELRQYMADLAQAFPAHQDSQSLQRRFISAFGPIEPLEREFLRFADGSMQ